MTGPLDMGKDPDRYDAASPAPPTGPLDMGKDPDRYDAATPVPLTPLDPAQDPDRFGRPGSQGGPGRQGGPGSQGGPGGPTLPGLLGEGAQEQSREGYSWALGLLAVVVFLLLVSLALHL